MSGVILAVVGREDDGVLVQRVRDGDTAAFAVLFERWFDRVYDVARGVVRRPELAADVAQDAFVAAWQQLDRLDDVSAFGGWLLRIARNKSLDALRREGRSTATDAEVVGAIGDRGAPSPVAATGTADPVTVAEAADTAALVWAAAAALGARDASLLDLHLRHGMTPAELAADLGVEPNHAHQLVFRLRKRLEDAVGSFLLWRAGRPACAELATATAGTAGFDERTAGLIRRHERGCEACRAERGRRTRPAALFSAVPIAVAPLLLRARAAKALAAEGIPVPPEAGATPTATPTSTPSSAPVPVAASAGDGGRWRSRALMVAVAVVIVAGASLVVAEAVRAPDADVAVGPTTTTRVVPRAAPAPPTTAADTTTSSSSTTTTSTSTSTSTTTPATTTTAAAVPPPPVTTARPQPVPPVVVADPPPPVATPATTLPPPPPPPPDPPPTIVRFTVLAGRHACPGALAPYRAGWVTEGATSATLQVPGGTSAVVPSGQRELCLAPGAAVTLTATSPGGSVAETAVAP